jgi:2-dehydro-3-deoxygalactonokinase
MSNVRATLCMDMGTTTTRMWIVEGTRVFGQASSAFGVRDLSAAGKKEALRQYIPPLLSATYRASEQNGFRGEPTSLLCAGMIGAPQGVMNVPHVLAPAGVRELRDGIHCVTLPDILSLPIFIVPGVRVKAEDPCEGDLIRGEESLCMGLALSGQIGNADALLNLGSHWKWIFFDEQMRIARSRTSLTGEMIHAVQAHTLLAGGLPQQRPETIDSKWAQRGASQAQAEGLSRALFCVRLLEQEAQSTPEQRLSFLSGAFLQEETQSIERSLFFKKQVPKKVVISGPTALASLWGDALRRLGLASRILSPMETESAYLLGLQTIAGAD